MTNKQKALDDAGREIVNNLPRYRDDIIARYAREGRIDLKEKKRKKIKPQPTIDMFPQLPSSRKEDL